MRLDRPARLLVLLAFLAGPFGLLPMGHADFHACAADGAHGVPAHHPGAADDGAGNCPVCHAAGTPGLEAPARSGHPPDLAIEGSLPLPADAHPAKSQRTAPPRSRAPPALS